MGTIVLTSLLDFYYKDESGNKVAHNFGNENGILDTLKRNIKKYDNFLFVGNGFEDINDYFELAVDSFELTLPFKNYKLLNVHNKFEAKTLIEEADFIFLCGGHLPTQNQFFIDINLKELIEESEGLICGGSAGSMNCADIVYCPPEVEGESLDVNFKRELKGLGLTNINILPHYDVFQSYVLDGKQYISEIIVPDSYGRKIMALDDGSYIVVKEDGVSIYGKHHIIENGVIKDCL